MILNVQADCFVVGHLNEEEYAEALVIDVCVDERGLMLRINRGSVDSPDENANFVLKMGLSDALPIFTYILEELKREREKK